MGDKVNSSLGTDESLVAVMAAEGFDKLSEHNQKLIIAGVSDNRMKDGGFMGRFFGIRPTNAAMNIAMMICGALLAVGLFVNDSQFWDKIIPIIAATIGYLFGKGKE